jgi:lipopolysaccharide/colanic/teichoic acid biosynthesis glycosyltransferase
VKRLVDLTASLLALVVLSPVLVLVALAVMVTMGRPVLFRQQRAGRHAKAFELYKFRTMRVADHEGLAPEHDAERLTALGRFLRRSSLDELPSLFNVVRGDLSLVGPRPLPMAYVERYSAEQARRLLVRPGLSGWAVVNGRNQLGWEERFALDCWYVDHRSGWLDLRIVWKTLALVLRGTGVDHAPNVTMTEFRGGEGLRSADPRGAMGTASGVHPGRCGEAMPSSWWSAWPTTPWCEPPVRPHWCGISWSSRWQSPTCSRPWPS